VRLGAVGLVEGVVQVGGERGRAGIGGTTRGLLGGTTRGLLGGAERGGC
jgi:hypothetical protein